MGGRGERLLARGLASYRRTSAFLAAVALIVAAIVWLPLSDGASAAPGPDNVTVTMSQVDGVAPFDASAGPGADTDATNNVVRTNDLMTYNVEVGLGSATEVDAVVTIQLARGTQAEPLPPFCLSGSTLNPASLPDPEVPTTISSWTTLPVQSITCLVGSRTGGSVVTYPFRVKVRPEVPNGTATDPVSAKFSSADIPLVSAVTSGPVAAVISARARFDLSKNTTSDIENSGHVYFERRPCSFDSASQCGWTHQPIVITTPGGTRGSTPLLGPITWTDHLEPESLYPPGTTTSAAWLGAGANALASFGARMTGCGDSPDGRLTYSLPASSINGTTSALNAVRNSGSWTCTQSGPGAPVSISVAGADTTVYTSPRFAAAPTGQAIPTDRGYVITGWIDYEIPNSVVSELGVQLSPGQWTLKLDNKFTDFAPIGIDGAPNDPAANAAFNDHRVFDNVLKVNGQFDTFFTGVPGTADNTAPSIYSPDWSIKEGPTGSTGLRSGNGVLVAGQRLLSVMTFGNRSAAGMGDLSFLGCNAWDNAKLALAAGSYPVSSAVAGGGLHAFPSAGQPVWLSAYNNRTVSGSFDQNPSALGFVVEYGAGTLGGMGSASTCLATDSPAGWFTDPSMVPGNDVTLSATGVYTAVNRVRVRLQLPSGGVASDIVFAWVSVGLAVRPAPVGQHLTVNGSFRMLPGSQAIGDLVESSAAESIESSFDPATLTGWFGDRLRVGTAIGRIQKEVRDPGTGLWTTSTPTVSGGDTINYRLTPVVFSGAASPLPSALIVEDCLPADAQLLTSSPTHQLATTTAPPGATLICDAGQTYVRWDFGDVAVNAPVTPIMYSVRIAPTATGQRQSAALITATGDPSEDPLRTVSAQINIVTPLSVAIELTPLDVTVEVNRPGAASLRSVAWRMQVSNISNRPNVSDVDVIDVLPKNGSSGSSFSGTIGLTAAAVHSGGGVTILYTSGPNVDLDAAGATNLVGGATVWCTAPTGGSVVSGSGTALDCPTAIGSVTALRVQRPGAFTSADTFAVDLTLTPMANHAADIYFNVAQARATGLLQPIGPVDAPISVVGSSLGDRAWADLDHNGVQDLGEPGIVGVDVAVTGTDSLGNSVNATAVTGVNGLWAVTELASGTYVVTYTTTAGVPGSQAFTVRSAGTDGAVDSDVGSTGTSAAIVLAPGTAMRSVDAGITGAGSIGDRVWHDTDTDGLQDVGEPGLDAVLVSLTGTTIQGWSVARATLTDGSGAYRFDSLFAGTYLVTVTPPVGWTPTTTLVGADRNADSNPLASTITLPLGTETDPSVDVGLLAPIVTTTTTTSTSTTSTTTVGGTPSTTTSTTTTGPVTTSTTTTGPATTSTTTTTTTTPLSASTAPTTMPTTTTVTTTPTTLTTLTTLLPVTLGPPAPTTAVPTPVIPTTVIPVTVIPTTVIPVTVIPATALPTTPLTTIAAALPEATLVPEVSQPGPTTPLPSVSIDSTTTVVDLSGATTSSQPILVERVSPAPTFTTMGPEAGSVAIATPLDVERSADPSALALTGAAVLELLQVGFWILSAGVMVMAFSRTRFQHRSAWLKRRVRSLAGFSAPRGRKNSD